jgi:hypothetical protein
MPQIGFIEHQRRRPQPFSVSGNMEFIAKSFSMPDNLSHEAFETALLDEQARRFVHTGHTCMITKWECHKSWGSEPIYVVDATPVLMAGQSQQSDQWITIGTATIDGTPAQINAMFGTSVVGETTSVGPRTVGGRMLRVTGFHLNVNLSGCAVVFCDIVRRQSEIDAEARVRPCVNCEDAPVDAGGTFCEACTADLHASEAKPTCPECGPHGNRGRVQLNFIEVACTTCAGGVPGDAFGVVEQIDIDEEVRRVLEKDDSPLGFVVPDADAVGQRIAADIKRCFPRATYDDVTISGVSEIVNASIAKHMEMLSVVTNGQVVLFDGSIGTVKDGKLVRVDGRFE